MSCKSEDFGQNGTPRAAPNSLRNGTAPEMKGYIVVSPMPSFALTDTRGNYEVKNIPPGKYTLRTLSGDGKVATQAAEVVAGSAAADLTVKK